MRGTLLGRLLAGALSAIVGMTTAAGDTRDEASKQDRLRIKGKWRIVSLVVDGNQAAEADARKLFVINGTDGTWSLRSADTDREISKGTSVFDPTRTPKTIDFEATDGGGKGNKYLGIYELGENTRQLCFAPPGKDRPREFASTPGSQLILVRFQREASP